MNKSSFVLNVNDNEQSRYLVSRALRAGDFEVEEAVCGEDALVIAKRIPDLIILDVQMPGIDGFEVCRILKADPKTSSIPIIYFSAHVTTNADRAKGLEAGADGYLTQPMDTGVLLATVNSVLRIKKAEAALRASVQRLEEEREVRERFVLMLSHDLRTPLSAAKLSAEMLKRFSSDSAKVQLMASRIDHSLDRADRMIGDLLDASRIRAGEDLPLEFSKVDLVEVVKAAVQSFPTEVGQVHLELPESCSGRWSKDALERAIENLVGNGFKYGEQGGAVTVRLSPGVNKVVLEVHNHGKALSAKEAHSIFDTFARTDAAKGSGKKGWGLGLTLVRGIVRGHHGSIAVQSKEGEGTTFRIELPTDLLA